MKQYDFDLVIVGGGLVGGCLALGLAKACPHLKLLVLEQKALEPLSAIRGSDYHDFNQKTLALNKGAQLFFEQLGIWPEDLKPSDFLTPIKAVQISMQNALGQFNFTPLKKYNNNHHVLGYIIQSKLLEKMIFEKKNQYQEQITWVQPIEPISDQLMLKAIPSGWQVTYQDKLQNKRVQVQTPCVIGSDGANSIIKKNLGISDVVSDYGHVAIIANVKLKEEHDYIAYERFTQEGGAMALLPYGPSDNLRQMTLVLTMPLQQAKGYQELSDEDLCLKLSKLMGGRFVFEAISQRITVPLIMKIATHQVARRAILMGNAAHFLHPIAAQGFNLSIQDIESFIQLIHNNTLQHSDRAYLGSSAMLSDYVTARAATQMAYIQATDKIARYYASQAFPSWLKGMSLSCLDSMPFIKHYFTQKSMGVV